jgi:hypothetical protein
MRIRKIGLKIIDLYLDRGEGVLVMREEHRIRVMG